MTNEADFIKKIHATPHKTILAITGGGSEVIGELLRHGDGSNTLLEAVVPYANASVDTFLGGRKPDKYCAPEAAMDLAMAAFQRVRSIDPTVPLEYVIGIGASSSLVKAGTERAGRQHHAYIGLQTHELTRCYEIELKFSRSREEEESVTAFVILTALGHGCGIVYPQNTGISVHPADSFSIKETPFLKSDPIYRVVHKLHTHTSIVLNSWALEHPKIILSGSFNPIHHRHIEMAEVACKTYGFPVDFEISISNPDKPSLNFHAIQERIHGFVEAAKGNKAIGQLYLTNTPTFVEKAELFCHNPVVFVVGYDTLKRIGNLRYCDNSPVKLADNIRRFCERETKFLAFQRVNQNIDDLNFLLKTLCTFVPETVSKDDGTSSTKLRKEKT